MARKLLLLLLFVGFSFKVIAQLNPIDIEKMTPASMHIQQQITISGTNLIDANTQSKVLVEPNEQYNEANEIPAVPSILSVLKSAASVCEDHEIRIGIETANKEALPETAKFSIEFFQNPALASSVQVTAKRVGDELIVQFPNTLNLKTATPFYFRVHVQDPELLSPISSEPVVVYPRAGIAFTSLTQEIDPGRTASVDLILMGMPPFEIELDNNQTIFSNSTNATGYFQPLQNTIYTIQKIKSGCGVQENLSLPKLSVRVREGITIKDPLHHEPTCMGSEMRVRIATNFGNQVPTKYDVNLHTEDGSMYSYLAQRTGDELIFTLPSDLYWERTIQNKEITGISVRSESPQYSSSITSMYRISIAPDILPRQAAELTFPNASILRFSYQLKGNGPYTIKDNEGQTYEDRDLYFFKDLYVNQNKEYAIQSIRNTCFERVKDVRTKVNIERPDAERKIYLEGFDKMRCNTDTSTFDFKANGVYEAENVFSLQVYNYDTHQFEPFQTFKNAGVYKILIPEHAPSLLFRIASSHPVVYSEERAVPFDRIIEPSNISIMYPGTVEKPTTYVQADYPIIQFHSLRRIAQFTYSDGVKEVLVHDGYLKPVPLTVGVPTTFTVLSASNACGTVPLNMTTTLRLDAYDIRIHKLYEDSVCLGQEIDLNGSIGLGAPFADSKYTLQYRVEENAEFVDLLKDQSDLYFKFTIPADWKDGRYVLRIKSSESVMSNEVPIVVRQKPTVALTSVLPSPVSVEYGQPITLHLKFEGTGPWTFVTNENHKEVFARADSNWLWVPTQSGIIKINNVSNVCGYGAATGEVRVQIKPTLELTSSVNTVCSGADFTIDYKLIGAEEGVNEYIKFQFLNGTQVVYSDSIRSKSGSFQMKAPSDLDVSALNLAVSVSKYDIYKIIIIAYKSKPDVLLAGNNVINEGESSNLWIRSVHTPIQWGNIKIKLSDGSEHETNISENARMPNFFVKPLATTTYTILSASNECGIGTFSGSATIEVNPVSNRAITVVSILSGRSDNIVCAADTITVNYKTSGSFTDQDVLTVHMSDENGANYKPLQTFGNQSSLRAIVPTGLKENTNYRFRIMTSDASTASSAGNSFELIHEKANAKFATNSILYEGTDIPKVVIELSGTAPWTYEYGTDLKTYANHTSNQMDTVVLQPTSANESYRLLRVSNVCGEGSVNTPNTIQVSLITGIETGNLQDIGVVAPNPTADYILIKHQKPKSRVYTLLNLQGQVLYNKQSARQIEEIDLQNLSTGIYLLQVESEGKPVVYKVIKQ